MTDEQKARMAELEQKCLKKDGTPRQDADGDDLTELAVLQAEAEAEKEKPAPPEPPPPEPPKETPDENPDLTPPTPPSDGDSPPQRVSGNRKNVDLSKIPGIAHKNVLEGYKYCGVDKQGIHILHNESGYWRIASDGEQLDYMGDGFPKKYLRSLKK